jgi:hypothetical protein
VWNPELSQLIDHATALCDHQARSEATLGFHDSAAAYQEMAAGARANKAWISHQHVKEPVRDPARRNPPAQPSTPRLSPPPAALSPAPGVDQGAHP